MASLREFERVKNLAVDVRRSLEHVGVDPAHPKWNAILPAFTSAARKYSLLMNEFAVGGILSRGELRTPRPARLLRVRLLALLRPRSEPEWRFRNRPSRGPRR
jgi:hypothetical protein